jgi:hypothetical protein
MSNSIIDHQRDQEIMKKPEGTWKDLARLFTEALVRDLQKEMNIWRGIRKRTPRK